MSLITVSEVREALGDAYSTEPSDEVISSYIDKREAELKEVVGLEDLTTSSYQSLLKRWLLNKVCIDVVKRDLIGKDSADNLDYSLGEFRESKDTNIKLKVNWIETMEQAAENALQMYFAKTISYQAVSP